MREEHVCGWHAVQAVLTHAPQRVLRLWVDERRDDARARPVLEAARAAGISVERANRATLDRLAGPTRHQGVVAACRPAPAPRAQDLPALLAGLDQPPLLLILDGVQDPHNLGACLRCADAAGVHAVILPRHQSVSLTPTVRKVASGAAETVPVFEVSNLARALTDLKEAGVWLVGAAGDAPMDLYQADLRGPLGLILGAEGEGMRRLTREHCDFLVRIPMAGSVASLNVSVAAGVCLFEAVRQRRPAGRPPAAPGLP